MFFLFFRGVTFFHVFFSLFSENNFFQFFGLLQTFREFEGSIYSHEMKKNYAAYSVESLGAKSEHEAWLLKF